MKKPQAPTTPIVTPLQMAPENDVAEVTGIPTPVVERTPEEELKEIHDRLVEPPRVHRAVFERSVGHESWTHVSDTTHIIHELTHGLRVKERRLSKVVIVPWANVNYYEPKA